MHYEVLANGTEVSIAEDHRVPCAALQVWVKVGAWHERQKQHGMAHFVEHMLFKGTPGSKAGELWQRVESWGGDINAYTDYDRTVYHLTLLADHTCDGIAALYDAIYHSELRTAEIAKEKEVVCEEIKHYHDDPSDRLYEAARQLALQGQVHPILGDSTAAVRAFDDEDLRAFYRSHYVPRNLAVIAVGSFELAAVQAKIAQLFGAVPDRPPPPPSTDNVPFTAGVRSTVLRGDYHKPRLLLALPAPCQDDIDTVAFDCAAFALGSGDTARLPIRLRDRRQLASAISCSNAATARWGMLEIATLTAPDNILALSAALGEELARLRQHEPITSAELARAQANAQADFAAQCETFAGFADNIAYGLTTPWKYLFSDCYLALLDKISPPLVQQALARWLDGTQAVIVCAVDEKTTLGEEQLTASFSSAQAAYRSSPAAVLPRPRPRLQRQLLQVREGVQLIHQPTTSELYNLCAVTAGGLSCEDGSNNGVHHALAALLGQENRTYEHQHLALEIEGRGAALSGFSDTDCLGLHLQCRKQDAMHLSKIFVSCLLHARFPTARWQTVAAEIADSIALQEEDPFAFGMQKLRAALFAGHPYSLPVQGTNPAFFNPDMLQQSWDSCLTRSNWVFAASLAMPSAPLCDLLREELGDFSPPAHTLERVSPPALSASCVHSYPKAREQCHIFYGWRGITWQDTQRAALDVLLKIKEQRLFNTLREQRGLVYTVAPILTYAVSAGVLGVYTACVSDNAEQVRETITLELQRGKPPTTEEIARARQFLAGNWHNEMSRGDRQVMHLARMQLFGVGHTHLDLYPCKIHGVNAADLTALSARLLDDQPRVCVQVGN